jgi:hypothetical protein
MTTAEKKSFMVRHPVFSFYLMSCVFFWALLGLFGAIVVGVLQVDPNTQPWTVWIVTIVGSWMPSLAAAIVVRATQGLPYSLAQMVVTHFSFNFGVSLVTPGWLAGAFSLVAVIIWVLQSRQWVLQSRQPAGYAVKTS